MTNFNIIKLDATTSSNDWLKDKFMLGDCFDGDVVWVADQTQGRGQRDRIWQSEPLKNLTFSLFKYFSNLSVKRSFLINCAVTLAVIEALKEIADIDIVLKWPNDILSDNNKIGGVLIENMIKGKKIESSIIGIGINVNQCNFKNLPDASSLFLKTGIEFDLGNVFERILKFLQIYLEKLSGKDKSELLNQYEKLLFQKGRISFFKDQKGEFEGTVLGVTENGLLSVQKTSDEILNYPHGAIEIIF
ncbi:MAG: biotin--[acetyl-CoA-carboxylase] ligase [Flavobacteriaceae bacterium TMED171]|nr:biotin--[acetyl-CoA-carboxylase] ligase [Flavobacteriaceae bacterium]OUW31594.1 MAG: biotin--[acetyl-CoA-carboxylase] ligase [Flavobacteriaceae bacterium TMED171]|tara:strand:- start:4473 stop:5210 length:738 start_codon:yes stop_codon:yes gene_type:complete